MYITAISDLHGHYPKLEGGDLLIVADRKCTICEKKHEAKGYCRSHYMKFIKFGDPQFKKVKREKGHKYPFEEEIKLIKKLIHYDEISGRFYWLEKFDKRIMDRPIEKPNIDGYLEFRLTIEGVRRNYSGHRVAFAFKNNRWPTEIDHINRNRSDNRIENLREVSRKLNCGRMRKKTRDLPRGVLFNPDKNKKRPYSATCHRKNLGYFETAQEASQAYLKEHEIYYGRGEI